MPADRMRTSLLAFAAAATGGLALGAIVFGWLRFGDAIYLTQLTAFVAGCF